MPFKTIPGTKVKWRPADETMADPDYEVFVDATGQMHVGKKPGFWTKAMPWLVGGGMGYGALAGAGLVPAFGSAATTTINAAGLPVTPGLAGAGAPVAPAAVTSAAGGAGAAAAVNAAGKAAKSLGGGVLDALKDPKNIAGLAALIPLLMQTFKGGDQGAFGGDAMNDEIAQSLALQRQRVEQTQPVFDTLVNMAYGGAPTRYRGAPPAGYPASAQAPVAGPYQYQGPRFGR